MGSFNPQSNVWPLETVGWHSRHTKPLKLETQEVPSVYYPLLSASYFEKFTMEPVESTAAPDSWLRGYDFLDRIFTVSLSGFLGYWYAILFSKLFIAIELSGPMANVAADSSHVLVITTLIFNTLQNCLLFNIHPQVKFEKRSTGQPSCELLKMSLPCNIPDWHTC